MSQENSKRFAQDIKTIAEKLAKSKKVIRYNKNKEQEAWTLAHAFVDLNESFDVFSKKLLPKLLKENLSEEEINNILHEIGEELRHVLYHIKDCKYYEYLDFTDNT